eukprot:767407-Rhodomonas_salina.1
MLFIRCGKRTLLGAVAPSNSRAHWAEKHTRFSNTIKTRETPKSQLLVRRRQRTCKIVKRALSSVPEGVYGKFGRKQEAGGGALLL